MKKIFTLIAMALVAMGASAQTISFSETAEAGSLDGKEFNVNGFILKVTDSEQKILIDANSTSFGTAEENQKFSHRLKIGGKSTSKNNLHLTVPKDGTLKIYARPGSSSATDRNVILTQNDAEIFNSLILESNYVEVPREGSTPLKVFTPYTASVKAGTIDITYPVGGINFYGFELVTSAPSDAAKWNFGTIFTSNPFTASTKEEDEGYDAISITDNLYAVANKKMAADSNNKTWSSGSYSMRLKTGGSGNIENGKVKGNGLMFKVSGSSEINVCAISSSGSATRKLILSDVNGNIAGSAYITGSSPNKETNPVTLTYSGGEAILYLYAAPTDENDTQYSAGGLNFYFVSATNVIGISKDEVEALIYDPASINAVSTVNAENSAIYNIAGQRVNANMKGLVIKNGKKYIVK